MTLSQAPGLLLAKSERREPAMETLKQWCAATVGLSLAAVEPCGTRDLKCLGFLLCVRRQQLAGGPLRLQAAARMVGSPGKERLVGYVVLRACHRNGHGCGSGAGSHSGGADSDKPASAGAHGVVDGLMEELRGRLPRWVGE